MASDAYQEGYQIGWGHSASGRASQDRATLDRLARSQGLTEDELNDNAIGYKEGYEGHKQGKPRTPKSLRYIGKSETGGNVFAVSKAAEFYVSAGSADMALPSSSSSGRELGVVDGTLNPVGRTSKPDNGGVVTFNGRKYRIGQRSGSSAWVPLEPA